ncbi:MAG: hypothetical protein ACXAB0_00060 [Candidatus Thorarchaeota archaeon]|jgi:hypothetical protein
MMTRTRLSYLSILFLSVLFLQAAPVNAHGPSAVHLDYDFGTQVLTVDVSHSTGTPGTHYIVEIIVEKNSVEFTSRDYTSQPSTSNIVDTFDVSAVHSDVLTVTAFCNIAGQLTESITVIDPSATTTTTDTTTSGGSTTSPTPPADLDLTLVIIAGAAGVVIIIIAVVFVKRG